MKQFKPMLASECTDLRKVRLPVYVSPKFDGIRAIVKDGQFVSRSLKPIRNRYIQSLCKPEWEGLDGELIVGPPTASDVFQVSTSGVMSEDGEPDWKFYVFDKWNQPNLLFTSRLLILIDQFAGDNRIELVMQNLCRSYNEVLEVERVYLETGYEGVMLREPASIYKYGRSTEKEGYLLKRKPFADAEAVILDFECKYHNDNEATTNALGHTERSSHKENLIPLDTLGALVVKCGKFEETFKIGTGYSDKDRKWIWDNQEALRGKLVKFRYQEIGIKDKPRFPSYLGLRSEEDM